RILAGDIDLQFLLFGETRLELIEVRAAGFGMPKLKDGETAVIGHLGYEVDDLEDAKAELTRRGVVLQGEFETDEVRSIFTAPETTFGVTLHLMEHRGRGAGACAPTLKRGGASARTSTTRKADPARPPRAPTSSSS